MNGRSVWCCAARSVGASIAGGLGLVISMMAQPGPTANAMSCFAISGTLTCIETAMPAGPPFMPPVIVPQGGSADGEDEHIVIRDDGGRQVARG